MGLLAGMCAADGYQGHACNPCTFQSYKLAKLQGNLPEMAIGKHLTTCTTHPGRACEAVAAAAGGAAQRRAADDDAAGGGLGLNM